MDFDIGDMIPVLLSGKLHWAIILGNFDKNRIIVEHLAINIYKILINNNVLYIDDSCIYNAYKHMGENYE
jgi:hypothetical protein